jgi:hypothetical protein
MKRGAAVLLGVFMVLLGLADVGQAQPPASVQVQGTIRAVDCNAQTVTLDTGGGTRAYRAASGATFYINSASAPLCALQQTVGAPAMVWLTALGNELLITRIDAAAQTYAPPPATAPAPTYAPAPSYTPAPAYAPAPYPAPAYTPAPYPAPYPYPYPVPVPTPAPTYYGPPPLVGAVLGTIIVAGLVYLLVRHPGGHLYRYPYYGSYYNYYYRPVYRPYYGPFRYAPAFVYGPYRWCPYNRAWGYWCR